MSLREHLALIFSYCQIKETFFFSPVETRILKSGVVVQWGEGGTQCNKNDHRGTQRSICRLRLCTWIRICPWCWTKPTSLLLFQPDLITLLQIKRLVLRSGLNPMVLSPPWESPTSANCNRVASDCEATSLPHGIMFSDGRTQQRRAQRDDIPHPQQEYRQTSSPHISSWRAEQKSARSSA